MATDIGKISWVDITADNADALRDFYRKVVGWDAQPVDMGGYSDYSMTTEGEPVSGICHARGSNADLPGGWLVYITVADVEASAATCLENGGKVVVSPRGLAGGRFCVIEDPSGAVAALYQP